MAFGKSLRNTARDIFSPRSRSKNKDPKKDRTTVQAHGTNEAPQDNRPPLTGTPIHLLPDFTSQTNAQSSCPLFTKLPPEIRILIWRACIGDTSISLQQHSWWKDPTPPGTTSGPSFPASASTTLAGPGVPHLDGFFRCQTDPPEAGNNNINSSTGHAFNTPSEYDAQFRSHNLPILSLLRSCRRIHGELVDLVYSTNEFYLGGAWAVYYFTQSCHPQHLSRIRRLKVNLDFRQPPQGQWMAARPTVSSSATQTTTATRASDGGGAGEELAVLPRLTAPTREMLWVYSWAALAGMKGVEDLVVTVGCRYWHKQKKQEHLYSDAWMWLEAQTTALVPAAQVSHVPRFRLILSWPEPSGNSDDEMPELSCTVERWTEEDRDMLA